MAEIKAIDKASVHQICSGQVILDLSIAIKELVENSLDAGATCIEVKLKENGLEWIEVNDNGVGVEEKNFAALTLKHHTSKLKNFSDLENVETFGFRGEALSSLCALCDITIQTRHVSSSVGYKLEYDHDGVITSQSPIARQYGTTVRLKNLFKILPVRHKELKKNIKKEYSKLLTLLSAYCIISTDVKITCSNQSGKSRCGTILSTQAGQSVQQHIAAVYGAKQLQTITEFCQLEPSDEVCEEYNLNRNEVLQAAHLYTLKGFVSDPVHGNGRSVPDRQFYFINSRPVELPRLARVINEVYHFHNRHQFPFVVLNVVTHRDKVDVNVTPDKRQVFIHNEKVLFAIVKSSLIEMYKKYSGDIATHNDRTPIDFPTKQDGKSNSVDLRVLENFSKAKSSLSESSSMKTAGCDVADISTPLKEINSASSGRKIDSSSSAEPPKLSLNSLARFRSPASQTSGSSGTSIKRQSSVQLRSNVVAKQPKMDAFVSRNLKNEVDSDCEKVSSSKTSTDSFASGEVTIILPGDKPETTVEALEYVRLRSSAIVNKKSPSKNCISHVENININISPVKEKNKDTKNFAVETATIDNDSPSETGAISSDKTTSQNIASNSQRHSFSALPGDYLSQDNLLTLSSQNVCESKGFVFDSPRKHTHDCEVVRFSMEKLRKWSESATERTATNFSGISSFRAQIDPRQNSSAEKELTRHLSRDSFLQMKPIGQFNLGFIIARLGNDLFIIDQHASDEIYNFETLQQSTEIHSLQLVVPQLLQLDPAAHSVLTDNLDVFRKNGFDFNIKIDENSGRESVYMTRVPVSKNWDFGSRDVDELIFMLSDAPHVMCRPSRIRQMFASRACRRSIMIGTALTSREMLRLIRHMSEITHPWNCPHGRPTMRHLIDLSKIT